MATNQSQRMEISMRSATLSDLDAMLEIVFAAFPMDPQWDYRFPYRLEYPEDYRHYTKLTYKEILENAEGRYCTFVAESVSLKDATVVKPIALAIWESSDLTRNSNLLKNEAQRRP